MENIIYTSSGTPFERSTQRYFKKRKPSKNGFTFCQTLSNVPRCSYLTGIKELNYRERDFQQKQKV